MTALNEVGLIASREMRKNLRSLKGLALVILSLLGAIAVAFLINKGHKLQEGRFGAEELRAGQEMVLSQAYDDPQMGKYLAEAPAVLLALLAITIWLSPLIAGVLGFDAVSGELQHRTVRYWTVRARRASYFAGKVLGLWGVVAALTLVMHVFIWVVTLIVGGAGTAPVSATVGWGFQFYLVTLPISAAWCGLVILISAQFRNPIFTLFVISAAFGGLWIVNIIGRVAQVKPLTYLYPNSYDGLLLSPHLNKVALGAAICFGICALATAVGTIVFVRRDV
ncbi:ABC transporter permease [Pendulispora rubella]|uniref:ABC transporter permease n=1 Tax=Pendulispora rubella TaxID=2741070 RepID=A0ABZ2L108_9BACT